MKGAIRTIRRRQARSVRARAKTASATSQPRLVVHRSSRQIYAQIIGRDGQTLASANSLKLKAKDNLEMAKQVGELVAKAALDKKIDQVSFDRKHYKYHGRVKALAEGARAAGLKF